MTAEPRTIRTEAEQALVAHFDSALAGLPGGHRVRAARTAAFDTFRRAGLPHRRVEEYKYTDLRALMKKVLEPAKRPLDTVAAQALRDAPDPLQGLDRYRLVLVDGHFFDALSDRAALATAGVEISPSSLVLAADNAALITPPEMAVGDVVLALNASFAQDGVKVVIRDGKILAKPLEIVHLSTPGAASAWVRNSVVVGAGGSAKIIETHGSADGAEHQANVVTEIAAGKGATVGYAKLQSEGDRALHLGTTIITLAPEAKFDHLTVTAGATVSRSQMFVVTGGEHARLGIHGACMLGSRQHADTTLLIDHALAGANTRVLVKSVVDGEARGVFQGKIIVERGAQKTDAKMMSKALLLSETAEFDAKPELEIFADDVQCGHGATSGRIDETQLFYLMARGVPQAEAERLLIEAFLDDAIDALGDEQIGTALKRSVTAWLNKRGTRVA